jgi:hypothetical protein
VRHVTHALTAVLQTGVAPTHLVPFVAEHWPQAPDASQAGVAPPQSVSPPHARHVCEPALQIGVTPAQLAFVRHPTQLCDVVLQIGVAPVQAVALPLEHWPHGPDVSHAGVAPPHSVSPPHARHVCVPVLHTGVVPPH